MSATTQSFQQQQLHALYDNHHAWLLGWLRRKLGSAQDAADLAQDTFVRIASRTSRADDLPGLREPRAFLTTIARALVVDFFRRADLERAYLAALATLPEALQPSPQDRLEALQMLEAVGRLLESMTPKTRTAWLLSRLDGLSHAEIAGELGVSVPRVRQYLASAARQAYRLRFGPAPDATVRG
ncbi:sigma-70 family RNA polymerase sigma factor [Piscinibacter gummiphilus]|uniref:RNA polymerase subunit sigma n=1 Tax=Piscinibacter gummiphilus TaxID=946333 RepID=A0A1W6L3H9_9BURK|nr:sigma-70 family RNA polymerase sigma factor [Piscinibacter gummiphilus]ARN18718.1 RNA polymerase subunit sigma [Piscinibacter gummiphilus]ATU63359.1 RNA polymerase subunit sigma [Piscinibacter gummiphilus]GLS95869.1 RNA polymerase sigma factor [Piscinibacter gummiphilus]